MFHIGMEVTDGYLSYGEGLNEEEIMKPRDQHCLFILWKSNILHIDELEISSMDGMEKLRLEKDINSSKG
jgi:hypothetical protein